MVDNQTPRKEHSQAAATASAGPSHAARTDEPAAAAAASSAGCVPRVQPEADARCVADVLAGRRERFEELVERYRDAVYSVLRGSIRDAHAAEDAAQDVFVNAFTSLRQLRERSLFFPWLMQIARRRAIQFGVRKDKHPQEKLRPLSGMEAQAPPAAPVHERMSAVLEQVEQLPEPYRTTVLLKYERNLSCEQIAAQEGAAIGTITSRLTRAMIMLRRSLRDETS
jgi:RNA polymerase sigma-70 factor (ECF subfamily)